MKARRVFFRIVASSEFPGLVSLRPLGDGKGGTLRRELTAAGYKPGDLVALDLAGEDETVVQ